MSKEVSRKVAKAQRDDRHRGGDAGDNECKPGSINLPESFLKSANNEENGKGLNLVSKQSTLLSVAITSANLRFSIL